MKRLHGIPLLIVAALLILGAGCLQGQEARHVDTAPQATGHEAMLRLLNDTAGRMQDALSGLDRATADAADALGTTGLSGPGAETVLRRPVAADPAVLTVITFDLDGVVHAAEPEEAKVLLDRRLDDSAVTKAIATRQPLLSNLFPLAQGGDAVVIIHPVVRGDGTATGMVSTAFIPFDLLAPIAVDASRGTSCTFMVIQTDGRILYDADPEEVGRETLDNALYREFPEILAIARQAAGNRTGYGTYSFYSTGLGKIINKETFWTTVGLYGTEWRVMVIRERGGAGATALTPLAG